MNRSRSTSILSISIGAILVIGAIAPALTQQAYGQLVTIGSVSTMEDLNAPTYRGDPGWFVFAYEDTTIFGDSGTNDCADATGTVVLNTFSMLEPFPNADTGDPNPPAASETGTGTDVYDLPNWIDNFLVKNIRIQLTWCLDATEPTSQNGPPVISSLTAPGASCDNIGNPISDTPSVTGAQYYYQDFQCFPNPDEESFTISYVNNDLTIIEVVIDTISEGSPSVGGTFEGVNTASLLVAGAQTNAFWLLPLIAAIGIGIVIARRQFS